MSQKQVSQDEPLEPTEPVTDAGRAAPGAPTDTAEAALLAEPSVRELMEALGEALRKTDEYWTDLLRLRAELDNQRKRASRDLANAHKYALERFITDLLPVQDSLELGIAAASEGIDAASVREGMELTLRMLGTLLARNGVEVIEPGGEKFNPERHQAMTMEESMEAEPGTVLSVIQRGYLLNDRLIRPAMVIVSKQATNGKA